MLKNVKKLSSIFFKYAMPEIKFTEQESKILELLKNVVKEKSPGTVLRIAGGFVRDKLLGKNSNDIDIAINNMTGQQFANLVKNYMQEKGMETKGVSVIESNPDQSKHLETAVLNIFGLPIDFVNLRTEVYNNSRIPEIQIGTPEEDAKRRDLTINSIFYNINNGELEDFVGGIEDLNKGIAKTPIDPVQTFIDDPLRILRSIRFAARYNLKLDPELIEAAKNPEVRNAFKNKISQERIWTELAGKKDGEKWKPGALIGENPVKAIELLKQLGLIEGIFDPSKEEMESMGFKDEMVPWETDQDNPHHQFNIWDHTLNVVRNLVNQTKQEIKQDEETYLVRNLAALLHDIGKRYKGIQGKSQKGHTNYVGHEETSGKMAEFILKKLRAPDKIIKRVKDLIDNHLRPHILLENDSPKALRKYVKDSIDWENGIDLAKADNLGKKDFTEEESILENQKYENLRQKVKDSFPNGIAGKISRPINGNDLIEIGVSPGPMIGKIIKEIDEKLLENPNLTKEEALEIAKSFITNKV